MLSTVPATFKEDRVVDPVTFKVEPRKAAAEADNPVVEALAKVVRPVTFKVPDNVAFCRADKPVTVRPVEEALAKKVWPLTVNPVEEAVAKVV